MDYQLLNETLIRRQSGSLQISMENYLAASVMEEIVRRISVSEYKDSFWLKNSVNLNIEYYRQKVSMNLCYYVCDTEKLHYKKTEISNVFAELFRNIKKDAFHWNYSIREDKNVIYADLIATVIFIKVPIKIVFDHTIEELKPYKKEIELVTNNRIKIELLCFPSEHVVAEKFVSIMEKLELINDMSGYMDIYRILKQEALSGRKVWELLNEGCKEHGIGIAEERFDLLLSYRSNRYMKQKWRSFLRNGKKKEPDWESMLDMIEKFFSNIWMSMCKNLVYLGDWMPELGRFID